MSRGRTLGKANGCLETRKSLARGSSSFSLKQDMVIKPVKINKYLFLCCVGRSLKKIESIYQSGEPDPAGHGVR